MSLEDGNILYYDFEDDSDSSTAIDISENGNDGTINGATYTSDSKIGDSALSFDGDNDYVEINNTENILTDTDTFSVSIWIKTSSSSDKSIISKWNDDAVDERGFLLRLEDGGGVDFLLSTDGKFTGTSDNSKSITGGTVDDGEWHHVVATYDNPTMTLYIDGSEVNSTSIDGGNIFNADTNIKIGTRDSPENSFFDGVIDNPAIWNRVITTSEIEDVHNDGDGLNIYNIEPATTKLDSIYNTLETTGTGTLRLDVTSLGDESSVDVTFRYRVKGSSDDWTETSTETVTSAPETVERTVSGLSEEDYEVQAVVNGEATRSITYPVGNELRMFDNGIKKFDVKYDEDLTETVLEREV